MWLHRETEQHLHTPFLEESWSESLAVSQQTYIYCIKPLRLLSRYLRNNIYVLMYSLSMWQMNTLKTILLLYEWNDILCHFACVIDWERNRRGYSLLSRWLGCAGPRWPVISPMPGGLGSIQRRGRVRGAFTYGREREMEMRDNEGWEEMIAKKAAVSQKTHYGRKEPKRTFRVDANVEVIFVSQLLFPRSWF